MRNGSNGRCTKGKAGNGGAPGVVRCAVYCRKSTTAGLDREFTSLDNQRESAEAFIRSQQHEGWIVLPDRYDDGGFSGANIERPALRRLLTDIEASRIDCVVSYKLDRISRDLKQFLNLNEAFERRGVTLISVTEPINTKTPMGRAFLSIMLSFAQAERETTAERTRDKVHAARRKGKFTGGGLVLGYDRHPEGGKLIVNEAEGERVRAIFKLFLEDPSIIRTVVELNRRGWTLKRWETKDGREYGGGPFDVHSLRRLLTNYAYIGKVAFDGAIFEGEHEAIVDRETWDTVQAAFDAGNGKPQRRSTKNPALLTGILRCGPCDAAMTRVFSQGEHRRYFYYRCSQRHRRGRGVCPTPDVAAGQIERFILDRLRSIGRDAELVAATVEAARQQLATRRRELEAEIRDAQKALDAAHAAARARIASTRNGKRQRGSDSTPASDVVEIEERLAAARVELEALRGKRIDAGDLRAALASFDPVWEHLTSAERARIVQLLIERIDYDGGTGKLAITFSPVGVRTLAADGVVPREATP